jgi:hypothetical protein
LYGSENLTLKLKDKTIIAAAEMKCVKMSCKIRLDEQYENEDVKDLKREPRFEGILNCKTNRM